MSIGSVEEEDCLRFWRRRFFKVFTIYGHGSHVGHVNQLICINFHSHSPLSCNMSFGSKWPNCFYEKQVLNYELWFQMAQLVL